MCRLTQCILAVVFLMGMSEAQATVIADTRADFVAGSNAGDLGIVPAQGTGEWRYVASDTANPPGDPTLDVLTWDTGTAVYRKGTTAGSFDVVGLSLANLAADELGLHPSASTRPPAFVSARWVAGAGEAGLIDISGNVRLTDTSGNGSISFDIFVDDNSLFSTTLVINDTVGAAFHQTATVGVGSTVDFVVGPNGFDTFDSTGLRAQISSVAAPSTTALLALGLLGAGYASRGRVY